MGQELGGDVRYDVEFYLIDTKTVEIANDEKQKNILLDRAIQELKMITYENVQKSKLYSYIKATNYKDLFESLYGKDLLERKQSHYLEMVTEISKIKKPRRQDNKYLLNFIFYRLNNQVSEDLWYIQEPIYFRECFLDEFKNLTPLLWGQFNTTWQEVDVYPYYQYDNSLWYIKEDYDEHIFKISDNDIGVMLHLLKSFEEQGIYPFQTAMMKNLIEIHQKTGDDLVFKRRFSF